MLYSLRNKVKVMPEITVIGNAIIDILVSPVDKNMFNRESTSVKTIKLSFGGDALNECVVLSKFGKKVELISKVGQDKAGLKILDFINNNNIDSAKVSVDPLVETSINLVLIDEIGERFFLSNPQGSQRQLSKEDIICHLASSGKIISLASMFISPLLNIQAMTELFRAIKSYPDKILSVDLVQEKNGLTLNDLSPLLPYVDYMMPNQDEVAALTGSNDVYENARMLLDYGCKCAIIKCGKSGSLIKSKEIECVIPAYTTGHCIDTTGAGDNFAAGFLWALSEQWSIPDCGCFASAVASCAVEHVGATEGDLSLNEVFRRFEIIKNTMHSSKPAQ